MGFLRTIAKLGMNARVAERNSVLGRFLGKKKMKTEQSIIALIAKRNWTGWNEEVMK